MKTYAWNFRVCQLDNDKPPAALVLRAISSDSIGVLKFEKGNLEFWHEGRIAIKTKNLGELFEVIDRIEAAT